MSNYNSLKTTIDANIKQNGNQEITGQILNSVLNQMVNILGAGYQFAGVATIATNPGTPDAKVFYIANGKGIYEKFGGINVTEDEVVVLYWDSSWHKVSTGIASQEKLSELIDTDRIFVYNDDVCTLAGITNPTWGTIYYESEPSFSHSDFISLEGATKIVFSTDANRPMALFFYTEKNYNRGIQGSGVRYENQSNIEVTIPSNAKYFVFCHEDGHFAEVKLFTQIKGKKAYDNRWHEKKWCCIGDSLTEINSYTSKHYYDYVSAGTGIKIENMGVGGTGYKNGESTSQAFYQRVQSIPNDCDVITIFGSGNDLSYVDSQLGTPSDTTTSTLYGCINTTINNILSLYPLAKIGLVTPTPWASSSLTDDNNGMSKIASAIETVAKRRGIPCLNLYRCSQLRPWDAQYRGLVYSKDVGAPENPAGVHPNEKGHELIAPMFKAFIESLIL